VFVFVLALLLRVGYLASMHSTVISEWHTWDQTDMATYLRSARVIQEEGLLVPSPYHPYDKGQAATGSLEQWERWLGGAHGFYRAPGYYYFLAAILAATGDSVLAVQFVQAVLGAGHAVLLGLVGARMMGHQLPGILVGLLAAAYGPFIAGEAMILREGPGLFLTAAGLYLVLGVLQWPTAAAFAHYGWRWLIAGLVLGLGSLLKETGTLLFAGVWLWALVQSRCARSPLPRFAPWVLLLGFLMAQVPFAVRNLLVGAPVLAPSSLFAWSFAVANTVDHPSGGIGLIITPGVAHIMTGADAHLLDVVRLTWQGYEGRHAQFFLNWWARLSAIWSNIEIPDNFSYDFLARHSPLLSMLPRFVCVWLPALVAVLLLGWRWIRKDLASVVTNFAPKTVSLLLVCLAVTALPVSLTYVSSRYRLTIVPFVILLAGWTLAQLILWLMERRIGQAAALSAALVGLSAISWLLPTNAYLESQAIRSDDFVVAAAFLVRQGDEAGARQELEKGLEYCRKLPGTGNQSAPGVDCTQSIASVLAGPLR